MFIIFVTFSLSLKTVNDSNYNFTKIIKSWKGELSLLYWPQYIYLILFKINISVYCSDWNQFLYMKLNRYVIICTGWLNTGYCKLGSGFIIVNTTHILNTVDIVCPIVLGTLFPWKHHYAFLEMTDLERNIIFLNNKYL